MIGLMGQMVKWWECNGNLHLKYVKTYLFLFIFVCKLTYVYYRACYFHEKMKGILPMRNVWLYNLLHVISSIH